MPNTSSRPSEFTSEAICFTNPPNLNQVIYHFGLSLNGDVIVRGDSTNDKGSKDYGKVLSYDNFVYPHHPILRDVTYICARNACSLNLEPGSLPLVRVAPNRIRQMKPEEAIFKPQRIRPLGEFIAVPL